MVRILPSVSAALAISNVLGQTVAPPLDATAREQKHLPVAIIVAVFLLLLVPAIQLMAAEPIVLQPN